MIVMKKWSFYFSVVALAMVVLLLGSCSKTDYLNAIPSKSTALISIDVQKMAENSRLEDKENVLKSLLHVDDASKCGIDVSEKIYLFESPDGNLGLCAKVADEGDLEDWVTALGKEKLCTGLTEKKGFHFSVLNHSWVVGFSDKALLVMGPVVADAQSELQRQMVKMLDADEEQGIKGTPMFERLDSMSSSLSMVAQAQALPEKFIAPFTLGAPKDADASQVVIAAEMEVKNGLFVMKGETFSFNKSVDAALKSATANYRPIKGLYVKSMPNDAVAGIFMNVDGKKFLPMMQSNKGIQQMLLGINTAIDMDNIIRSVDGDMAIVLPSFTDSNLRLAMSAKLGNSKWLEDVDYWKQSCPQGSSIADWGKNAYYYTDGKTSFYFGVTDDMQFYSGSDELMAQYSVKPSNHPIQAEIQKAVVGQKLAMVINLGKTEQGNDAFSAISGLLTPIFGKFDTIIYTLK